VVGYSNTGGDIDAFLWENGVMTALDTPGDTGSAANGVNPRGQVAGDRFTVGESDEDPLEFQAFLWEKGVMTDLGTLAGGFSQANAINPAGQVVGFSITASGESHATLWTRK
jgi:probable HAF family extracellular repeat protein